MTTRNSGAIINYKIQEVEDVEKDKLKILYNFVNAITEEQINELIKRDKDFLYKADEYNEVFQQIFDELAESMEG